MPKHFKPEHERRQTSRKSAAGRPTTEGAARDAGRKLLLFAGAAIAVVLLGAWWLMRS